MGEELASLRFYCCNCGREYLEFNELIRKDNFVGTFYWACPDCNENEFEIYRRK